MGRPAFFPSRPLTHGSTVTISPGGNFFRNPIAILAVRTGSPATHAATNEAPPEPPNGICTRAKPFFTDEAIELRGEELRYSHGAAGRGVAI